ncbi:MAG: hypothetical protein K2R98_04980 [Gemmataceae bacterium]|nr:hypothetical protein [Gemmataceae bacterium]
MMQQRWPAVDPREMLDAWQASEAERLRERLLGEMSNVELRQRYLAIRGSVERTQDLGHARRRLRVLQIVRGVLGLALVGFTGSMVGEWMLGATVRASGGFAIAVKVGTGSALVAATVFAVLGALGHVVFADVIGDFHERRRMPFRWATLMEVAIEFHGGAIWGAVCGLLIGAITGAVGLQCLHADAVLGGAIAGAILAALGIRLRAVKGGRSAEADYADLGPLPWRGYLTSSMKARGNYLRKRRQCCE